MRVLVDECLPRQLRHWSMAAWPYEMVATVQEAGWASMKNGALLRVADAAFNVLVTADKNMHHQQNFMGLKISVLVFPTNRAKVVHAGVAAIAQSRARMGQGRKAVMSLTTAMPWDQAQLQVVAVRDGVAHHEFGA